MLLLSAGTHACWAAGTGATAAQPPPTVLRVTGSSTMCPMVAEIAKRFEVVNPTIRVGVECGGSDRGIRDTREGRAEVGMVTRTLKPEEAGLVSFPMARDGVSVIVNRANPVEVLTPEQIAGVFSGRITNWREVGGRDAPITVILRETQKPVTELFTKYFGLEATIQGRVIPGDNPVTINAVAAEPAAIAYVSSGEAERKANAGVAIRPLPLGDVVPTARNVITGNYPITRPLTLITRGLPAGAAKSFVDYCLSSKVVDLVERFDFVPYED